MSCVSWSFVFCLLVFVVVVVVCCFLYLFFVLFFLLSFFSSFFFFSFFSLFFFFFFLNPLLAFIKIKIKLRKAMVNSCDTCFCQYAVRQHPIMLPFICKLFSFPTGLFLYHFYLPF